MILPLPSCPARFSPGHRARHPTPGATGPFRTLRTFTLAVALMNGALAALAQTGPEERPPFTDEEKRLGYSTRSFLAKSRAGVPADELQAGEARAGLQLRRSGGTRGEIRVLEAGGSEPILALIERMRATGHYDYVEPDYLVKMRATPNDPSFLGNEQWALRNIGQENGTAGADIRAESGWDVRTSAAEIIVAVIDSGIRRTHEDLVANLWSNPGESGALASNGRDDDANGYIDDANGIDATVARNSAASGNPNDRIGHGTSVASIIGASGNNRVGMTGVAWNVKLMALRFIGLDGYGLISDEIECVDYAIAKKAHIINASFGGSFFSQSSFDAYKRARDAGIIVICAAPNESENSDLAPSYPSNFLLENIVSVTNTTRHDMLYPSAGFGTGLVELGAPGSALLTASIVGDREYRTATGTSFAAPMVAGTVALLKAQFSTDTYRETINRLLRSVDPKPALQGKTATGGRLNLANALRTTNARPFNDEFAQRALYVGENGIARASSHGATREAGEPVHAGAAGTGTLWWTWTAPRSGSLTLTTTDSAIDTLLAVYSGNALTALTELAANDDESGSVKTSKVTLNVSAGTTYQIAIDNKGATAGLVLLRFALLASNNDFASAQLVSGRSWSVKSENRSATREGNEPRIRNNAGGRSVWYRWVAPATRRYHIASYSDDFDTMLGIYTGSSLSALSEVAAVLTASDSNNTVRDAGTTLFATAGTTYYIVVDSEVPASGTSSSGEFRLSCIDSEWETFGRGPYFSPALSPDNTLLLVDSFGYLSSLNTDGTLKWRHLLTGYGTFSSPAVGPDGTAYVGDDLGYVYAVNSTGGRKWRTTTLGPIEASPAVAPGGTIYVRSEDGRLHALLPDSGTIRWSFRMGDTSTDTYSSPVIAPDGTIYCAGSDRKLYAITPDGGQKWVYGTDFIFGSPAIADDGTIYFGVVAPTRRFIALKPDGTLKWDYVAGDTVSSSPVIGADGSIFFGCADRKVYALTPAGELRWTYETGGEIRNTSPILASDGTVYIGSQDGTLYALTSDGKLRRTYATANAVLATPLLHNGRLYLPSEDGRLYALEVGHVPASTAWPVHRQNNRRNGRRLTQVLAIGVQPRPVSAEVGETVTFAVGAVGAPPLSYQWLFNGQAIAGATGPSYSIDSATHANGGQFSARVTDGSGNLTSSAVALTITTPLVAPSIVTPPANQNAFAGGNVTLSLGVTGTVPMTYQWFRDGAPVPGATSSTLTLADARPSQSGNFAVRITNFAGTVTSAAAVVTIAPVSRISNLSIRSQIGGSTGPLTVGLTIGGAGTTGAKPVLLRAAGPTLASFGVDGTLADPQLAILSGQTVVAQNDDWAGNAEVAATSTAVGAFGFSSATSKDAALAHSAASGGYTVRINGTGDGSGVALAEVYDASPADSFVLSTPRLTNVSALTHVGTGSDVLITGFSITGTTPKTVLIRGIGPTLAAFGVTGALADPKLELFQAGSGNATSANDNWGNAANATQIATAAAGVGAFALAADSRDAVLLLSLPPGSYTAQVSGAGTETGLALVEVYEIP
ncbi:MAG: PQQ-binding-like beta-propeller repeat protein [Opitutaceae bacterium]|nr:PQQ-binding-like beta-propeller repeat protein [Opitutaceae bacterium]